ncbi:hypothetical protein [Reyranella sp.]|uniref:hypothetical protein n=1 Tax=Reyranella sp. TaxID=1929291 RepID=UPI002730E508|nr:hypothetical protein [Reyranella sp.]MDP2372762.1 hypothetical protein [Reyranella sp.]
MSPSIRRRRITAASPTPKKLATFLRHLEESGSVSFAARRAGIGRNTVYERRKVDPAFASGWRDAVAMAVETLRDRAIRPRPRRRQPPADVPAAHAQAGGFLAGARVRSGRRRTIRTMQDNAGQ